MKVALTGAVLSAAVVAQASSALAGRFQSESIVVDGLERTFVLYVPDEVSPSMPVVLVFHGGGGSASSIASKTKFHRIAEREGFLVVYPNGLDGRWTVDDGRQGAADDLGFVDEILATLRNSGLGDSAPIFATGLSRGGMFAYHLACNRAYVRALAPVAATLTSPDCTPASTALFHVHAVDDESVPFEGGFGRYTRTRVPYPPVQQGIDLYADADLCDAERPVEWEAKSAVCLSYAGCMPYTAVELCLVDGGHGWPGSKRTRVQKRLRIKLSPFPASEEIWAFFAEFLP